MPVTDSALTISPHPPIPAPNPSPTSALDSAPPESLSDRSREPEAAISGLAEVEAVGREIAEMMIDEQDPDAQLARDHLLAALHQPVER